MKCHFNIRVSAIVCLYFASAVFLVHASPDAETLTVDELTAEHRSAKPEPFLDKIAAFFAGNTRKQDVKKPTYPQTAASVPRPQYVRPPVPPKPPVRPQNLLKRPQPVYDQQPSSSNNFDRFSNAGPGKPNNFFKRIN